MSLRLGKPLAATPTSELSPVESLRRVATPELQLRDGSASGAAAREYTAQAENQKALHLRAFQGPSGFGCKNADPGGDRPIEAVHF